MATIFAVFTRIEQEPEKTYLLQTVHGEEPTCPHAWFTHFFNEVLLSPQHDFSQQINAELLQSEIDFDRVRIQWY